MKKVNKTAKIKTAKKSPAKTKTNPAVKITKTVPAKAHPEIKEKIIKKIALKEETKTPPEESAEKKPVPVWLL